MPLPPNDSQLWVLAKLVVVCVTVLLMAEFGTKNGFDWRTDIPALLAILGGLGLVQGVQKYLAPKE
jgi:hypothetical protein